MDIEVFKAVYESKAHKLMCDICGLDFYPFIGHYIAKDPGKSGLANVLSGSDPKLYDAFNCPYCGCQIIAKERKNAFFYNHEIEDEDEEEEE